MNEGNRESALSRRVKSVSWRKRVKGGAEGGRWESLCKWIIYTGFLELFAKVMMADLSQSQNKLTMRTHTHCVCVSRELDEVTGGWETCFILIARLEGLEEQYYTMSVCALAKTSWWQACHEYVCTCKLHNSEIRSIKNVVYLMIWALTKSDVICWKTTCFHMLPLQKSVCVCVWAQNRMTCTCKIFFMHL